MTARELPDSQGQASAAAPTPPKARELLRYWGVVAAWMAVISLMSGDPFSATNTHRYIDPVLRFFFPDLTPAGFVLAHSIIRKTAHFVEFYILGALAYWASRRGREPLWRSVWALQALAIAGTFALVDEGHQRFVASRTGSLTDSLIDFCGAAASQMMIYLRRRATVAGKR